MTKMFSLNSESTEAHIKLQADKIVNGIIGWKVRFHMKQLEDELENIESLDKNPD